MDKGLQTFHASSEPTKLSFGWDIVAKMQIGMFPSKIIVHMQGSRCEVRKQEGATGNSGK